MAKKQSGILLRESSLNRRYPESKLASEIFVDDDERFVLPSKFLAFNEQIGGGVFYGTILELMGEESAGKTMLAKNFAAVCQSLGGFVLWNDAEASFTARWARKNGLDLAKVRLLPDENIMEIVSDWLADMCIYYRSKYTKNEPILAVIDSIATWETKANMETSDSDSGEDMGRRAKMIYKVIRKRVKIFAKYGICVICINQLRNRPVKTKFDDPETSPGGLAMRYYASQRVVVKRSKIIQDEKKVWVGQEVYIKIKKNKVAEPKAPIRGKVHFKDYNGTFGFDNYAGLVDVLVENKAVRRKRGMFYMKGKLIARGDLAFEKLIRSDDELRKKLVAKAGIMTVSKTRTMLNKETKNRYPVKMKAKSVDDKGTTTNDEE